MAAAPGNVMRWKKLVVRDLPHDASCEEVLAVCGFPIVYTDSALRTPIYPPTFFRWEAGKPAKNGRTSVPSRLTLQFRKDPDQLEDTLRVLHGKEVTLANGSTIVLSVHVAPNQRLPREKPRRRDNKSNTIAKDPDFIAFLEELNDPDKKSLAVNNPNILDAGDDKIKEKPVSALVKFLNERRAERRDKNGKVGTLHAFVIMTHLCLAALRLSSSDDMNPPMKPNDATASSLLSVGADCFKVVVDTGVSEVAMLQHLYGTMDYYGHTVTVKIITGATLVVLYLYVSGTSVINLEAYDPVVVDHAIAAIALSGPVGYALLLNMYYSDVETPVGLTLLTLRISCCCIIGAALTVFLAECFTRRLVISLVLMGYGAWGIGYAWSVPLWRWYMYEVRRHGLVAFLPAGLQDTLLRMTLLEWLTDTTFADKMRDYFPFFLPLDNSEQQRVMHSLPTDTQTMMKKPGLVHLLPSTLQEVLLPSPEYFSDSTDVVTSMPPLPATPSLSRIGEDSRTASTSAVRADV
ncbi:hypothetical protein DYB32_007103 [Aphanomyces invadans]|uniref:UPF3 domain-containing protein n=1 Tax=Aphanomyces invadans TaxID=157072 RepID=A0A418APU2_9STRA|nr:hypothetical protein DYB32_007103 [Aphanomyces invadans]